MTGPFDSTQSESNTSGISRIAAEFVSARRSPSDWSSERQSELEAWLAQSLFHRVAYLRIDAAWQRTERLAALRAPMRPIQTTAPRIALWQHGAGAIALLTLLGVILSQALPDSSGELIETPKGGQETIRLADGSQVELNTDTAIKIDYRASQRTVELLRGEAYFEIKHDPANPFTVVAADRQIVDLGTKFVVRLAPRELKVALLEGKASLKKLNTTQQQTVLLPGDVAVATADSVRVTKASSRKLADTFAWRRGSIVFHYERLDQAVAELNRYGGPRLVVADSGAASLLISGTFLTNRPEDFAGIVHEIFGLHVKRHDGDLFLSR